MDRNPKKNRIREKWLYDIIIFIFGWLAFIYSFLCIFLIFAFEEYNLELPIALFSVCILIGIISRRSPTLIALTLAISIYLAGSINLSLISYKYEGIKCFVHYNCWFIWPSIISVFAGPLIAKYMYEVKTFFNLILHRYNIKISE